MDPVFDKFEYLPVSVFCCDKTGRILYKNRFASAQFSAVRRGACLGRFCDPALPDGNGSLRVRGQTCTVFCRTEKLAGEPVDCYCLLPGSSELARQKTAGLLESGAPRGNARSFAPEADGLSRRHALKLIREKDRIRLCAEMLFATLSGVRDVRPDEAFAFSGVDFAKTFSALLTQFRLKTGVAVEFSCRTGLTVYANYYDLHLALIYVLQYAVGILCTDKILVCLTGDGSGVKISVCASDPYGATGFYGTDLNHLTALTPILYPLACADYLCRKYRGRVQLIPCGATKKPAEFAVLKLPTTYELPQLNVRDPHDSYDPHFRLILPNGKPVPEPVIRKAKFFDGE